MNLYEAIFYRKSIRKYKPVALSRETLNNIETLISKTKRLYEEINMKIHIIEDGIKVQEISKGIVGSYGKILAPHYLMITSEEKKGFQENIGYTLEQIVLKLTTMGIGTCWIGGFIRRELLNGIMEIPQGQKPIIVIAFGIPLRDYLTERVPDGDRRKPISEIILNNYNEDFQEIIKAVRRAPSGVNCQPWRLAFEDNTVDMYLESGNFITKKMYYFNKIDGGIALAHLKVACDELKVNVKFQRKVKLKNGLEYLTTAVIEK